MIKPVKIIKRIKSKSFLRVFSFLFVLSWFIQNVHILHETHSSEHHHAHHDPNLEKDPCHRKIFHGDHSNGCKHEAHINKKYTKCNVCDQQHHTNWSFQEQALLKDNFHLTRIFLSVQNFRTQSKIFFLQTRGPPDYNC